MTRRRFPQADAANTTAATISVACDSMTSSARPSSVSGTVRFSALDALRLGGVTRRTDHILLGGGTAGLPSWPKAVRALAWRSLCQMPLCLVGVELGPVREHGAEGAVHIHRDLVEQVGR